MTKKILGFSSPVSLAIAAGATTPDPGGTAAKGVLAWSTTLASLVSWNGASWQEQTVVFVGTSAPTNPSVGDIWVDST